MKGWYPRKPPGFDLGRIRTIRLTFNRSPEEVIILDVVGLDKPIPSREAETAERID